ncbi:hypothetical protein [Cryobacterium sp. MDB2-33-2]|uniref:hypothetical protein n=1 Tax=Cryobacterium sp. MDB2-33-2 TaxID=1259179 RepID=UPI00106941CE|nr:hypothetical protein [Cryobacterium sp. MDB2-33-2]TFC04042.1 hypothetical protein E3O59_14990 [Cryobacterium sp. MDB2-33-2]
MRQFFTWLGIGLIGLVAYSYGAKAGRGRYREIKATIDALWNDPRVKKARKHAHKQVDKATKYAANQTKKIGR